MDYSDKIKHVFVLMLENRSFDHLLGYSNINGKDAVNGNGTSIDGLTGNEFNIGPDGKPYSVNNHAHFSMKFDPGHEFNDVLEQLCGAGASYSHGNYPPITNSGFITNYAKVNPYNPEEIMNCFDPDNLRILNQLSNEFVICDRWFSSIPGPTWPNRFYAHAASSGGREDSPSGLRVVTSELGFYYTFTHGTIFDKFDDSDYIIYTDDPFPQTAAISGVNNFKKFEDLDSDLMNAGFSQKYIFIEPNYNCLTGHYDDNGNSMHPLCNMLNGEKLLKHVYEYIRKSPHWESSVLIVTFDEHGGFYDHVLPPRATAPGDFIGATHKFDFQQYGVRIPAIIISPLIEKNLIEHTVYDNTSILATVEKIFNLSSLTYRDGTAHDFCHLFTLSEARKDTPILLTDPKPATMGAGGGESSAQGEQAVRDPVEVSTIGFLEIGLLKYYKLNPGDDKSQLFSKYNNFLTNVDVQNFLLDVNAQMNNISPQKVVNDEMQSNNQ